MRHARGECWCGETHTAGEAFDLTIHGRILAPDVYDAIAEEGAALMERERAQPGGYDRVKTGGLMRCCLETLDDLYADGPARMAAEGQVLQCKYAPGNPLHRMIFRSGAWEWDHEREGSC